MDYWLRVWKFLDENDDIDSIIDISRRGKISYDTVTKAIKFLDDIGYINLMKKGNKIQVLKTQKFIDDRKILNKIIKTKKGIY